MKDNLYTKLINFYNVNDENFKEFMAEIYKEMLTTHRDVQYVKEHLTEEIEKKLDIYLVDGKFNINIEEKVNEFLENNQEITDIISKLTTNTNNIKNINSELGHKANLNEVFLINNGININNFDEETRRTFLNLQGIDVNYVLGKGNVHLDNLSFVDVDRENIFDKSKAKIGYMLNSSGIENANQSAFVSDYINIKGYGTLSTNASWNSAFYDTNKEFIQLIASPHSSPISVPETAYYIRIVGSVNKIDEVMLTPGEALHSSYVDYNNYSINITDTKFINDIINKTYKKNN